MAEKKEPKVKKIKPYTPEWEREANALARQSIRIRACGLCGHPAVEGYVCNVCGEDDSVEDDND